ncbi:restriction endonuclease subunit S [Micromonospora arborensis]|uniref:restriction endonuclease subunit S n=1 Tax=Micromonospora arborensis TaxID=2116518 RepID=UPI003721BB64
MNSTNRGLPYGATPPSDWKIVPLKHLATLSNGYVFKSDTWRDSGTPIIRIENLNGSKNFNYSDIGLSGRYQVGAGDLLYSWSGNPGTSFGPFRWNAPGKYFLNQHIFKVSAVGCDKDWLYWALKTATHWIERELTSGMIGMVHVTKDELANIPLPLPPLEEQRRIADFLDAKIARNDRIIETQNRALGRLAERRAVFAHAAVTGLREGERRPTSVPWSDALPAKWGEGKLSLFARMGSGHTPSRSRPDWWLNCTIPWITTGEVAQIRDDRAEEISETREKISEIGLANSAAELCPRGTVVLCRTASAGYSAVMGADMATSQDFVTWQCGPKLNPFYLLWCLRAMRGDLLGRLAMGSTHKTIYVPDLQMLRIPLPSMPEQQRIVELVRRSNRAADSATDAVKRQVTLLTERRQALITAAVTGQFDVTTARGADLS